MGAKNGLFFAGKMGFHALEVRFIGNESQLEQYTQLNEVHAPKFKQS